MRDLNLIKCIKDEYQRMLVKEEEIKRDGRFVLIKFLMKAIQEIGANWAIQQSIETAR